MNLEEIISKLPPADQAEILKAAAEWADSERMEKGQKDFLAFVHTMWPGFIDGRHHKVMAQKFEEIASGKLKRLIINMPPRHAIMLSMKIPTLNGWKTMADLNVGDHVFGPDGIPIKVLGKSEVFEDREIYRVTTDEDEIEEDDEDEDQQEFIDDKFLFAIYKNDTPGITNTFGNMDPEFTIVVTPYTYWKTENCCYDGHTETILKKKFPLLKSLGQRLGEEAESSYTILDEGYNNFLTLEEIIKQ